MEQEIERIARLYLNNEYQDNKYIWRTLDENLQINNTKPELPHKEDMLLALLLRVIDRIEGIEKLLQPTSNAQ